MRAADEIEARLALAALAEAPTSSGLDAPFRRTERRRRGGGASP